MKQIDLAIVPSGPQRAPGTAAKAAGGPLQSAEAVVAPASRKKAPARTDQLAARTAPVEESGIGNAKTENPSSLAIVPPEETQKKTTDTVIARAGQREASAVDRKLLGAETFAPKPRQDKVEAETSATNTVTDASDSSIGDGAEQQRRQEAIPVIAGIGDRAFQLALVAAPGMPVLRQPRLGKKRAIGAARPTSRSECERRSGGGCFCDPSSEASCGGLYCGRSDDGV